MVLKYISVPFHLSFLHLVYVSASLIGWGHCTLLCCKEGPPKGSGDPPGPGGGHRDQEQGKTVYLTYVLLRLSLLEYVMLECCPYSSIVRAETLKYYIDDTLSDLHPFKYT